MAKIYLNIEADTVEELQTILGTLQSTQQVVTTIQQGIDTKEIEKAFKKEIEKVVNETEKKPKAKAKAKEEVSTDSTSETKNATPETKEPPVDETEPTTSATPSKYPDATKEDVTAAVKKALADKKRNAVRTALERQRVAKVPELDPANYGVFLTDLEVLVGE